jgi:hypothetical protein
LKIRYQCYLLYSALLARFESVDTRFPCSCAALGTQSAAALVTKISPSRRVGMQLQKGPLSGCLAFRGTSRGGSRSRCIRASIDRSISLRQSLSIVVECCDAIGWQQPGNGCVGAWPSPGVSVLRQNDQLWFCLRIREASYV